MPRDLSSLFIEENVKLEQSKILHLMSIGINDETTVNIVDSNYDIKYNEVIYSRFPVAFSDISVSSDGSIMKATLTVANVGREMQAYVEQNKGLRNRRVVVKTVFEKFVDEIYLINEDGSVSVAVNPDKNLSAFISDEFLIDSYSADETTIQFQLEPVADLQVKVPRRRYTSNSCYWKYKDSETCGYSFNTTGSIAAGSKLLNVAVTQGLEAGQSIDIAGVAGTKKITGVAESTKIVELDTPASVPVTNAQVSLKYCEKNYDDCKKHVLAYTPPQTVSGTNGQNYVTLSTISENEWATLQSRYIPGDGVLLGSTAYIIKTYSKQFVSQAYQYRLYFTTNLTSNVSAITPILFRNNAIRFGGFMGIAGVRTIQL
jgi:lambda family phage minor tail protein L